MYTSPVESCSIPNHFFFVVLLIDRQIHTYIIHTWSQKKKSKFTADVTTEKQENVKWYLSIFFN